jgi:hypothetical protein
MAFQNTVYQDQAMYPHLSVRPHAYCPQCGQIDAVRKVSSIASTGTRTAHQFGIAPDLNSNGFYMIGSQETSVSDLARRLSPFPQRPGGIGIKVTLVLMTLLLGGVMAGGLSLLVVTPQFGRFACGNWVLSILVTTIILSFLELQSIAQVRRRQEAYDEAMERAIARWKQLYYCSRDDIAFNPSENTLVPVEALNFYLFSQA